MAGDWIKMRTNLWDDPRVARLCDLTDQSEAAVIGGLYWLWMTADQRILAAREIDTETGTPGFASAACRAGFLYGNHMDGYAVVKEDHFGALFIVGVDRMRPFASAWLRIRAAVFDRDGHRCKYCGAFGVALECDHVVPVALGGGHELSNLAAACKACNRSKGKKSVQEFLRDR